MTPLAIFGICLAIALGLFILPYLIFGSGITLLIIIFPAMAAEAITGERGADFSRKSIAYITLVLLFVFIQVLILAAIFFALYCLFFGYPAAVHTVPITSAAASRLDALQVINKILLLALIYLLGRFMYQTIKYREAYRTMNKKSVYFYQVLSLILFPAAFIYLIACLNYFRNHPLSTGIGIVPSISGCLYALYTFYSLVRTIMFYGSSMRNGFSGITFRQVFSTLQSFIYGILFLYFFSQMREVLAVIK